MMTESVIGADDRVQIVNTASDPWRQGAPLRSDDFESNDMSAWAIIVP